MEPRELLRGVVDLHVHAGPSFAKRNVDAAEMLIEAENRGYRCFVIKDHNFPTVMSAKLVEKHVGKGVTKPVGAIVLNSMVGGYTLKAVSTTVEMGGRMVFLPTLSSPNHIDKTNRPGALPFRAAGKSSVPDRPVHTVDANGKLLPEVVEVLSYLATQPQVCIGTGHLDAPEVDAVIREAVKLGCKNIVVNHPYYLVDASMDDMKRWTEMGAFMEVNACVSLPYSRHNCIDYKGLAAIMETIGPEHCIVSSDFGALGNYYPVDGLGMFLELLGKEIHVTEEDLALMSKINPAKLIHLDDIPMDA